MRQENIAREFAALPPEARKQVVDFIEFLKTRYIATCSDDRKTEFSDEPFIGMWRDCEEMKDSSAWVRNLRNNEWTARYD
jgi:hypothetical protein